MIFFNLKMFGDVNGLKKHSGKILDRTTVIGSWAEY